MRPLRLLIPALLALALLAPGETWAFGENAKFQVAQLRYSGGNWDPRSTGLRRLAWEVMKVTSIEMALERSVVTLDSEALFQYPLLYVAGSGAFDRWKESDIKRLRRYLESGGLVLFDSTGESDAFSESARREMDRVYPDRPLTPLKPEHVVYKTFYLVNRQGGRVITRPYLEGVEVDNRTVAVLSHNDLGGAWARDGFGNWEHQVIPGGRAQREMTFRLGINLMMYALCLDYKEDQVHVPFILKRRR